MAAFKFFDSFTAETTLGNHTAAYDADTDLLKVYLTNITPVAGTHLVYDVSGGVVGATGLQEFAGGTGYTAGGIDVVNTQAIAANITRVIGGTTPSWTATAADWTTFQFVVLYNTSVSNKLIGWWDNGSSVDLANTQTFSATFGDEMFKIGATA